MESEDWTTVGSASEPSATAEGTTGKLSGKPKRPNANSTENVAPVSQLNYLVIDSGAIIRGEGYSFPRMAEKLVTVQEVISEIRDSKSREKLESFPYTIEIRAPTEASMKAVADFAKKTGDFAALSMTDLRLIALLHTLEMEVNGGKYIRDTPKNAINRNSNQVQVKLQSIKSVTTSAAAAFVSAAEGEREDAFAEDRAAIEADRREGGIINDEDSNDQNEEETEEAEADEELNAAVEALDIAEGVEEEDEEDEEEEAEDEPVLLDEDFPTLSTAKAVFQQEAQQSLTEPDSSLAVALPKPPSSSSSTAAAAAAVAAAPKWGSGASKPCWAAIASSSSSASSSAVTATTATTAVAGRKADSAPSKYIPLSVQQAHLTTDSTNSAANSALTSLPNNNTTISTSITTNSDDNNDNIDSTSRILSMSGFGGKVASDKAALEDDGEGWISVDNIAVVRAHGSNLVQNKPTTTSSFVITDKSTITTNGKGHKGKGKGNKAPEIDNSTHIVQTALITTDFAMQNVMIQMGLNVLSVDGLLIKTVKQFVLMCIGCRTIHYDMSRLFCTKCGGYHLSRIGASIDTRSGELRLHLKKNYQYDLRGTKYNVPLPGKAGKYDGELLLREDQLHMGLWKQRAVQVRKDVRSAFGEDITNDVGLHINKGGNITVGYGRKNPNAEKGRERRGKAKRK